MKVRITVTVDERERYVIGKYYGSRSRATRAEVRRFVASAVPWAVRQQLDGMGHRQRSTASKLSGLVGPPAHEPLRPSNEEQLDLLVGVGMGEQQSKGARR